MRQEYIGICRDHGTIYEGSLGIGTRSAPQPLLLPLSIAADDSNPKDGDQTKRIFREDFFDPITKIRRGRVFTLYGNSQPYRWPVMDVFRPDLETVPFGRGSAGALDVFFYARDLLDDVCKPGLRPPDVHLGAAPHRTVWRIISVESTIYGTPSLTLKSYRSLGDLPDIRLDEVPENIRLPLATALTKVEESVNRLSPVDVIDRCRDAMSLIFGVLAGDRTLDLGKATSRFVATSGEKEGLLSWASGIVARLHSRGKPNEQHRHGTRSLSEEDAQLALRCLGLALLEVEWPRAEGGIPTISKDLQLTKFDLSQSPNHNAT